MKKIDVTPRKPSHDRVSMVLHEIILQQHLVFLNNLVNGQCMYTEGKTTSMFEASY